MFSDWGGGGDFNFDLTKPFPLRDETVSAIYMSHALEHFSYPSPMLKLLSECKRLLQKGGTLRISVPNARLFVNAYLNPSNFPKEKFCGWEVGLRFDAPIDYLNFVAYLGNEHKHLFDEEGLAAILRECGFSNVRIDEFDSDVDLASRDHESLYAVATK